MKLPVFPIAITLVSYAAGAAHADIARITVLDADGKPVPAAKLDINIYKPGQPNVQRETDAEGKCEVDTEFSRSGPLIAQAVIVVPGYAIGGGQLKRGENVFRLEKTRTVSGLVTAPDGAPVANARVVLVRIAWDAKAEKDDLWVRNSRFKADYAARTDANGRWEISAVPASSTSANFALDDPLFAYTMVRADGPEAKTIVATKATTIRGRVVDEAGKPVSGITVTVPGLMLNQAGGHEKTVTAEDGSFTLESLPKGLYSVAPIADIARGLVGRLQDEVRGGEGEVTTVPDLLMTPGVVVQGTVVDADTGVPVKGAGVSAFSSPNQRLNYTPTASRTDENGAFSVRVLPGKTLIRVSAAPVSFLVGDGSPEGGQTLDITANGDNKLTLKLKPAFFLAGTARGEDGAPLANIEIFAGNHDKSKSARTDENGAWRIEGLPAGPLGFWAQQDWEVIEWPPVSVPFTEPVNLKLRGNNLQSLRGRIVDTKGKPVSGARVTMAITFKSGDIMRTTSEGKVYITDANGAYKVSGLKSGFGIKLSVEATGYRYLSGGQAFQPDTEIITIDGKVVPNPNAVYVANDAVMESLMATVKGKVVDSAGKAVAGIRVFSPDGEGGSALTAADGTFTLTNLPDRTVEVMAAGENSFAVGQGSAAAGSALTLQPCRSREDELALALKLLEAVPIRDDGTQPLVSSGVLNDLVSYDVEAAFRLAEKTGRTDGTTENRALNLVAELAKRDPEMARQKADLVVAKLKAEPQERIVLRTAGVLTSLKHPASADFYKSAREYAFRDGEGALEMRATQQMSVAVSAFSMGVNADEVRKLVEASLATLQESKAQPGWAWAELARRGAAISTATAESILEKTPRQHLALALEQTVPAMAPTDLPAALRLLEKLEKDKDLPDSQSGTSRAATVESLKGKVVPLLAKTDPVAALAMARQISAESVFFTLRPLALVEVARVQPPGQRLPLFREAFDAVGNPNFPGRLTLKAQIAAATCEHDLKAGLALFDDTINQLTGSNRNQAAAVAFYLAPFDGARSRQLAETVWAKAEGDRGRADMERQDAARAMAAVDAMRADEMLQILRKGGDTAVTVGTQIEIARTALTPRAQRKNLTFRPAASNFS